jgi:hypothetical protein
VISRRFVQGSLSRACAICALGAVAFVLSAAAVAPASRPSVALAAVRRLLASHARACGISPGRLYVTRLGDPLDLSHTLAYRVDASVGRRRRSTAFAAWEVRSGVPVPVSPLAGEIARGCPSRDPRFSGWRSLPYLDYDSGVLDVTTSLAWQGALGATGRARRPSSTWAQPLQEVRARACTLTRSLHLPGRPERAEIRGGHLEVRLNGEAAARTASGALTPQALRLFRHGANRLELRAPGPPCRILAELTGAFRADAAVEPFASVPGSARIDDQFYRRPVRGTLDFTVENRGPSDIPSATFVVHVGVGARLALVLQGHRCRRREATFRRAPPYGTLCTLHDLRAGARVQLHAAYRFVPRRLPFGSEETSLTWEVRDSPWDAYNANELRTAGLVFCGVYATGAGCARAP